MKPDGGENELLQEDTPVMQLLALDNKLYAQAGYPVEPADGMSSDLIEFQQLDECGKPLSSIEVGEEKLQKMNSGVLFLISSAQTKKFFLT